MGPGLGFDHLYVDTSHIGTVGGALLFEEGVDGERVLGLREEVREGFQRALKNWRKNRRIMSSALISGVHNQMHSQV